MPYDPQILASWSFPEFESPERPRFWYLGAGLIFLILLVYAIISTNFLFAVVLVMAAIIWLVRERETPLAVNFEITDEGLQLDHNFYDYEQLENFYLIYKPDQGSKNLYFHFKSKIRPRLSIPLREQDPVQIRDLLLNYLQEDLDQKDIPTSEWLGKIMKL
ncbi:MAG: hypothetical protein NTV81_02155 [Candidatus Komeilibacteria bacterium]|nr:hypothetical protein [Candidatus Komeilibacteria bacterium]